MATLIYSQYSDAKKTSLQAYFGVAADPDHFPQDPVAFPNQCVVASDDPLYATFYESLPEWWTESWVKPAE